MEHTFPRGKYYLGDPCYALSEDVYMNYWGKAGFSSGKMLTPFGFFIVCSTAYGDGEYTDGEGWKYPVDSGTLALIPWEMCAKLHDDPEYGNRCGRVVSFDHGGTFSCPSRGKIEVYADINITINTAADEMNSSSCCSCSSASSSR